ncbi:hypothetical protein [Desulfolucanica intricata]|uniref:hypothetical protein n=1 Tax=Desulfolucanica intricata TaxID=1285191 RepID=UPI000831D636|nr:hypothetical protein [Desulfolucanica intricata]
MTNIQNGENIILKDIKVKVRLDFKGLGKSGKFLFGGKPIERAAEETRDQQIAILKNVPIQGVHIEDIDMSIEVYTVYDEVLNNEAAYAPVELLISADSLEDIIGFITRDEFRTIEIIEPSLIKLTQTDLKRLFFKINEEMTKYKLALERKYNR